MSEIETQSKIAPPTTPPVYATPEQVRAYRSPEPLQEDYTHSETGQVFRIEGISRIADRQPIYAEQETLLKAIEALPKQIGYEPELGDLRDAAWCASCVTMPKMSALEWLRFGAEADLWELSKRCLVTSRSIADQKDKDADKLTPDGVEAAENALKSDPLEPATL